MHVRNPLALQPGSRRRRSILAVGAAVLGAATIAGGLMATALPAFADVTTNAYTIGAPSGAVSPVTASPNAVGAGAVTNFEVTFDLPSRFIRLGRRLSDRDAVHIFGFDPDQRRHRRRCVHSGRYRRSRRRRLRGRHRVDARAIEQMQPQRRPKSRSGLYRRRPVEHRDYALQRNNLQERYLGILQLGDDLYLRASAGSGLSGIRRQYDLHDKRHIRGQCER